jgi:DNA-binding beta-propeller fold protein YncE
MRLRVLLFVAAVAVFASAPGAPAQQEEHYLYVATPGWDAATDEHDDHGVQILIFDIEHGHRIVKHISVWPAAPGEPAEMVRGIAAHARTSRLFLSTVKRLAAVDLVTEKVVWQSSYDGHCCDRFAVSPDGRTIYAPAFGSPKWYVISAVTGELVTTIAVPGWPRDTRFSPDGASAYLAAWESTVLSVADTRANRIVKTVGPFSGFLCPFTVNAKGTLAFANVDGMAGFEVVDLQTGLILDSVSIEDVERDEAAQYECPSHGIAFSPSQRELWVADGVKNRLHVFDAAVYPPAHLASVDLTAQPRWIAFSLDGRYAYPSTGSVIDAASRKIVGALEDGQGAAIRSEKLLEIDFSGGVPIRAGV